MFSPRKIFSSLITFILFALLILSFALWGIGDVFRLSGGDAVLKVGHQEVSLQDYARAFAREKQAFENATQQTLTQEEALKFGLDERVLQTLLSQAVWDEQTRKLHLGASKAMIRKAIREIGPFDNEITGQFDKELYERLLQENGFTPQKFEQSVAQDLRRAQFLESVSAGFAVPDIFTQNTLDYYGEQYTVEALFLTPALVPLPPAPDDDTLKAYITQHQNLYQDPERRALTLVRFRVEDFLPDIKLDEKDIQAAYDIRKEAYNIPETRSLTLFQVPDEASAQDVVQRLKQGETSAVVTEALGLKPAVPYRDIRPDDLLDSRVSKKAFALEKGEADFVEGEFGRVVVLVDEVTPARATSLEEARPGLEYALKRERAEALMDERMDAFEQGRDQGMDLVEAAGEADISPASYAPVDRQGGYAGASEALPELVDSQSLLETAFSREQGFETSLLEDGKGGFFVLRVDSVVPSAPQVFEDIKGRALQAWQDEQQQKALAEYAEELLSRLKTGQNLQDIADELGEKVSLETLLMTRQDPSSRLNPSVIEEIFEAPVGGYAAGALPSGEGWSLVRLQALDIKADNGDLKELVPQQMPLILAEDALGVLQNALRQDYKARLDRALADRALNVQNP